MGLCDTIGRSCRYFGKYSSRSISNIGCVGAGCFWGTEKYMGGEFLNKFPSSNIKGEVGYMGPTSAIEFPSYEQVCTGKTGHVEVFRFSFDGGSDMYEKLIRFFYTFHDPTTLNQQGNDRGTQYASVIYYFDEEQKQLALKVTQALQEILDGTGNTGYKGGQKVLTDIRKATTFYPATPDHQEYLKKNPWGYCNHKYYFKWPEQ